MLGNIALIDIFSAALPLLLMVICAFGFYALGKWLRGRGHGGQLDAIDAFITRVQRSFSTALAPLAMGIGRLGHSLNRLPLLGSKRQRQQWDEMETRMHENSKRH